MTSPYEGTYYLTARRHGREADRDQGSRRRRRHFRRRRQLQPLQRQGRQLQLLRGHHVSEYRHRDLGRHAVHRRIERVDGQEMPSRERRHRHVLELLGLERLLHRRQHVHRPRRSGRVCSAGAASFWPQFKGVDGQEFPPKMASYVAVKIYGPGTSSPTTTWPIFTTASTWRPTGIPTGRARSTVRSIRRGEFRERRPVAIDFYNNYMTNFHDNAFEIDGSLHNIRVMRNMMVNSASHPMCNQPAGGGPVYWIRNIIYHAPGGSTRMTSGAAGVLFYNNTILTETAGGLVGQRALAEQSVSRREHRAGDLQRDDEYELQFVGLQRLPPESRRERRRFNGIRRRRRGGRLRHSGARRGAGGRRGWRWRPRRRARRSSDTREASRRCANMPRPRIRTSTASRRLRRVRERAPPRREGPAERAEVVTRRRISISG